MFLASIREDGLLPPEPGSFVLEKLPTASKRIVCAGIVDALREATDAGQIDGLIGSQEGISWHLQVLGSAFTLPFDARDDIDVAQRALELMIGWLAPKVDVDVPPVPTQSTKRPSLPTTKGMFRLPGRNSPTADSNSAPPSFKDKAPGPCITSAPTYICSAGPERKNAILLSCFKAMSLLFGPRPSYSTGLGTWMVDRHAALCIATLRAQMRVIEAHNTPENAWTEASWEVLIKLQLGICSALMRKPGSSPTASPTPPPALLTNQLCPHLVRSVSKLMLMSRTKNTSLWIQYKALSREWWHLPDAVAEWHAMFVPLTADFNRSLARDANVAGGVDEEGAMVVYQWGRMLQLVPSPRDALPGDGHEQAIGHIQAVCCLLLQEDVAASPASSQEPNDTVRPKKIFSARLSTVLRLFGAHLYPAATEADPAYYTGRARAIAALCSVFLHTSVRGAEADEEVHLCHFYHILATALDSDVPILVQSVLVHAQTLFSDSRTKGARALLARFVRHVKGILLPQSDATAREDWAPGKMYQNTHCLHRTLRAACLHILATCLPFPNKFSPLPNRGLFYRTHSRHRISRTSIPRSSNTMPTEDGVADEEEAVPTTPASKNPAFAELRACHGEILMFSLTHERDEGNLRLVLWGLCVKLLEDAAIPGLAQIAIYRICKLFFDEGPDGWGARPLVQHDAISVLTELAEVASCIQKAGNATLPTMLTTFASWVQKEALSDQTTPTGTKSTYLLALTLDMIRAYVSTGSWGGVQSPCGEAVFQVALTCAALTAKTGDNHWGVENPLVLSGKRLLNFLLHHLGRDERSGTQGETSFHSLLDERNFVTDVTKVVYFAVEDHTIVCAANAVPGSGKKAVFVMRTSEGKFSWSATVSQGASATAAIPSALTETQTVPTQELMPPPTLAVSTGNAGANDPFLTRLKNLEEVMRVDQRLVTSPVNNTAPTKPSSEGTTRTRHSKTRSSLFTSIGATFVDGSDDDVSDEDVALDTAEVERYCERIKTAAAAEASLMALADNHEAIGRGALGSLSENMVAQAGKDTIPRWALLHLCLITEDASKSKSVRQLESSMPKFWTKLKQLDSAPVRAVLSAQVNYVSAGLNSNVLLDAEAFDGSRFEHGRLARRFYAFLLHFGWPSKTTPNASSVLEHATFAYTMGIQVPVWEHLLVRVGVEVPCDRSPAQEAHGGVPRGKSSRQDQALGSVSSPVCVVWNDSGRQIDPSSPAWPFTPAPHCDVLLYIVLYPLERDMCRVHVYKTGTLRRMESKYYGLYSLAKDQGEHMDSIADSYARSLGPLVDGMVIHCNTLGCVLRQTIVNVHRIAAQKTSGWGMEVVHRQRLIREMIEMYAHETIGRTGQNKQLIKQWRNYLMA